MKKTIAMVLTLLMLLSFGAAAFAESEEPEWDASVPTEISEEVQTVFDQAMEGLLGVNYVPVAVLGQQGNTLCILCKATAVYPNAKPYNALVYISQTTDKAELQNICELGIDAHSGKEGSGVLVDYGTSELYSEEEMDDAIALILDEFNAWEGCEMHAISYAGDECNSGENVSWMNSLGDGQTFTHCIEFVSEFHSPVEGGGAWEPDTEYTGWQWWLARPEGGSWELMTWGY